MLLSVLLVLVVVLVLLGLLFEQWSQRQASKHYPPDGQLVDIGGRSLHLFCTGSGTPTILLEAGGGTPSIASRQLQTQLSKVGRVCSYDRAGLGWSQPASGPRSFVDLAEDLGALVQAANLASPFIVVAESYGGLVARQFCHQFPDKIAGLVLVDAAEEAHVLTHYSFLKSQLRQAQFARWFAELGVVRLLMGKHPSLAKLPQTMRQRLIALLATPTHFRAVIGEVAGYEFLRHQQPPYQGFGSLGRLPLVVIQHGVPFAGPQAVLEQGWVEAQHRLADLSSNSTLVTASDSGHQISLQQPELIVEAVVDLIAQHGKDGAQTTREP